LIPPIAESDRMPMRAAWHAERRRRAGSPIVPSRRARDASRLECRLYATRLESARRRHREPADRRTLRKSFIGEPMLKKARSEKATGEGNEAKDFAKAVVQSSRQIWLAGLGAFSRAQAEGAKVFESLVKQGEAVETKT